MNQEKMMEFWRNTYENTYYQWGLTQHVYDYLEGKIDKLTSALTSGGKKYHSYYQTWITDELDGENHELARRMLVVISKIRSGGLITGSYSVLTDAETLLRIGYDFTSVVDATIHKFNDIPEKRIYDLAVLLLKFHPEESLSFADKLLTDEVETLIEKRKSTRDLYLAIYIASALVKADPTAYGKYIPAFIKVATKIKNNFTALLLYYTYDYSPELKELLLQQILTSRNAPYLINSLMKDDDQFIAFLQKIGSPSWPYYYIKTVNDLNSIDKASILFKLYQEDRATFMDLYQRIEKSNYEGDQVRFPYLLVIRLQNGETDEDPERTRTVLLALMKRLMNEYSSKFDFESQYYDEEVPLNEIKELYYDRAFSWGTAPDIIGGFSILYDYSSRAKRFIQLLLTTRSKSSGSYNNDVFTVGYFLRERENWLSIPPKDSLETLFAAGLSIEDAFRCYCYSKIWASQIEKAVSAAITREFILEHEDKALTMLIKNKMTVDENLTWADLLYQEYNLNAPEPLFAMLANKSKLLRKKAEEIMAGNEELYRPLMEEQMDAWKGEALASVKRLIKRWDNERKFGSDFSFQDNATVTEFCTDNFDEANQKFISWIPEDMLTDIQFIDLSEKAPSVVMKYLLSEYMALENPYRIKACDRVVERLNPQDLQGTLENIYQLWKDTGAEAKKKMVMVPYCLYASDSQILRLKTQLKDWVDVSRGAVAAFVVNAIAMNGGSVALMMIDGISVKFPGNQVKNAAKAAFSYAAQALEIPEDELSDKIVPTLGFSRDGLKVLDYGTRTFNITLMPDFSLTIYDNDKKKTIKSMPAPGANDDTIKATAAKKEFSELKKQMKAAVQTQTNRLEKVLMNGRRWNVDAWKTLFVENPIMHRFATGLIWGVYDDSKLIETFRYMDDGTFNTVDEDEFTLPENASITLAHPIEMDSELVAQWKEQLDDYEVVQPLPQLSAPMARLQSDDVTDRKVTKYRGIVVKSGKIAGMARKFNMVRGEVWDAGSFTIYHWVDKFLNVAAQLNFEYMWMGQEYNEDVTLGEVIFYRLGEGGAVQEEPKDNMILDPADVPARFVSTVIGVFDGLKGE